MLSYQTYLIFAVNGDQVRYYIAKQSLWERVIVRSLKDQIVVDECPEQLVMLDFTEAVSKNRAALQHVVLQGVTYLQIRVTSLFKTVFQHVINVNF